MPIGLRRSLYVLAALPPPPCALALQGLQGFDGARLQRDAAGRRNFDDLRRDLPRGTTLHPTSP